MTNATHLTPALQNEYANAQAARDQGIADASNGFPAFAWFDAEGEVFVSGRDGLPARVSSAVIGDVCLPEYREAFAYARAYSANS